MTQLLHKLRVKNLEDISSGDIKHYKADIYAGYTNLGSVLTDFRGLFETTISDGVFNELSSDLTESNFDRSNVTVGSHLESLIKDEIKEQKTYELLEVPRDCLRDYIKENPDDKYNSFVILYIKQDGTGSVDIFKTEKSTQSEGIDGIIRQVGLQHKEDKQAIRILGFHYISLRKILTTEIL